MTEGRGGKLSKVLICLFSLQFLGALTKGLTEYILYIGADLSISRFFLNFSPSNSRLVPYILGADYLLRVDHVDKISFAERTVQLIFVAKIENQQISRW